MRILPLIIVLVTSLISTLFAQDCNNPLLRLYGLTALDSPQSGADLPYCNDLKNAETCCSADTVSSFQSRLDGLIDKLNNYDAARDLYIAQLRNSFLDRFDDLLEDINDDLDSNLQAIRPVNAGLADQLQNEINNFTQINNDARDVNNQFAGTLNDFQAARNSCFVAALQVRASSWCLACDPNYATEGVNSDGTVTFSDGLCQGINDACWPYFNQSARFNPLIRAREAYWRLAAVAAYLKNLSNTGQVVDFNVSQDPYNPLSTQRAVTIPEQWSAGDQATPNNEYCQDLWTGDQLLTELVPTGNPAAIESEFNENELIIVEEEMIVTESLPQVIVVDTSGTRLLQDSLAGTSGVWAPDLTSTGLNFSDLRRDPGDYFGVSDYSDFLNETGEGVPTDNNIVVIDNSS